MEVKYCRVTLALTAGAGYGRSSLGDVEGIIRSLDKPVYNMHPYN